MPITETLLAAIFVLFCATLRGFTGFGLAVALVPLLALVMTPQQAVPIVLVLQVAAGLQSLRSDWPHIDWRSIGLLLPGAVLGLPIGLFVLAQISPAVAKLVIGLLAAVAVLTLASGWRLKAAPGKAQVLALGGLAGVFNGLAAMPGVAVVALFLASPQPPAVARASMVFFFLLTGAVGALLAYERGLLGGGNLLLAGLMIPPMMAGTWLGGLAFQRLGGRGYRPFGVAILAAIAVMAVIQGVAAILG